MGCGEVHVCQHNQYCDEASGMCSECSLVCTGGQDAWCQEHCCGFSYQPPPKSSTVSGSAVPVFGPKATPQCDACSHVALYIVLSLALLLLVAVILLVVKHYRKYIQDIFNQCKGTFLTPHGTNSSREEDVEAQPLIDHWTEVVRCWRELIKLLDRKDASQAEDEAVDCTCAHLAVDFKRWAGLFGKHGDRVLYARQTETGEDMPGGSSEQPQTAAEYTGELSRSSSANTDPDDKKVKSSSVKPADQSEIPSAPPSSQSPQPPAHGAREHSVEKGAAEENTKDSSTKPHKTEGNDPKNKALQNNLTPARGTRHTSQGAAEGTSDHAQAIAKIPHRTGASSNAVPGTSTTTYVTTHSKEGHLRLSPPKKTRGAQPKVGSHRPPGPQTDTHSVSQAPAPHTTAQVDSGATESAATGVKRAPEPATDRVANSCRAARNAEDDLRLRAAAPAEHEQSISLDLRSDDQGRSEGQEQREDSGFTLSPPTDYTSEGFSENSPTERKRPYRANEPGSALRSPSDHTRPSQAATHEEATAISSASTVDYNLRSDNTTSSNPGPSGQQGGGPQPDSVNSESHLGRYWPHPNAQPPVSQDRPGDQLSVSSAWSVHPKSH